MRSLSGRLGQHADKGILLKGKAQRSASDLLSVSLDPGLGSAHRVLVSLRDSVALIESLVALDGRVDSFLLAAPYLSVAECRALSAETGCNAMLTDRAELASADGLPALTNLVRDGAPRSPLTETTWFMTTSGTTGSPKPVPHRLASLMAGSVGNDRRASAIWGLCYDPSRFGGMQVVLHSLLTGHCLILPDFTAQVDVQIGMFEQQGCTHLSATPSLWRRFLMVPGFSRLSLSQITLGGEPSDGALLRALRNAFPAARITQVFASTEIGVGFSVNDGLPGFPVSYLARNDLRCAIKIVNGMLWLKPRFRSGTVGYAETDVEGYQNSGDRVAIDGDRVRFLGRASGVINVGGTKVSPEAIEQTILSVEGVAMAKVTARANALTGAIVAAEVVTTRDHAEVKAAILARCRAELVREAVPGLIRFVDDISIEGSGKVSRRAKG